MNELVDSIYNKRTEVHYNQWFIKINKKKIKLELQGKIRCPLLNTSISSLTCGKLMDKPTWPRYIDKDACRKCGCKIHVHINRYASKKDESKQM